MSNGTYALIKLGRVIHRIEATVRRMNKALSSAENALMSYINTLDESISKNTNTTTRGTND